MFIAFMSDINVLISEINVKYVCFFEYVYFKAV